jgi:hypothetical protein
VDVPEIEQEEVPTEDTPSESAGHVSAGGVSYTTSQEADTRDLVEQNRVPAFLQRWYNRYYYDRKYVSDDALLLDTDKTVSVNYLYRNTQILSAQLLARAPKITVRPKRSMGPPPPLQGAFAKTCELLVLDLLEEAGMRDKLNAAIPDASGVGWAIFKLTPQEDYRLDPIGRSRMNDELDNVARCQWLRARFAAKDFGVDDRQYQEMLDCEKQVAAFMREKLEEDTERNPPGQVPITDPMTGLPALDPVTGMPLTMPDPMDERLVHLQTLDQGTLPDNFELPEVARYIGVTIERIMPEDYRFDWSVTDPVELRRQCRWMAHRVFMDRDTFGAKFNIPVKDWQSIGTYDVNGVRTDRVWQADPALRTDAGSEGISNIARYDDRCIVWEIHHRERGMIYTVVEGLPYPLAAEPASVTWREWFPFFFLWYNRVDGRAIPLSDTLLCRALQDEINRTRTQDQQYRQWSLPRFLGRKGAMTVNEKAAVENSYPGQWLEMSFVDDVRTAYAQPMSVPYNPMVSDISMAKAQMQEMSGITAQAQGNSGDSGELATTATLANEYMGNQMDARRFALEKLINDFATATLDYMNAVMPEVNVKQRVGQGAVWPNIDRTVLFTTLNIHVRAGSTGKPDARKRKEFFTLLPAFVQALAAIPDANRQKFIAEFFDAFEIDDDPQDYFLPMAPGMPPMLAPGVPGMPPPGTPGTEGGAPGPGAPPMAEAGPPAVESIPNGPMSGPH